MDINKIQRLNAEIENFRACYEGNELWSEREGPVQANALIEFLIEHPELPKIAETIKRLNNETKN